MRNTWLALLVSLLFSCGSGDTEHEEEQLSLKKTEEHIPDSLLANQVPKGSSLEKMSYPQQVVLTGMPVHRLVTLYKKVSNGNHSSGTFKREGYDDDGYIEEHFMPGLDLLNGYNLIGIAHYDLSFEKLNFLFDHPVLVKNLYFPSLVQDSINRKPISRDYYLVSVYNEDTNRDSLINKFDLRRFYFFNASASEKIQLLPSNYSVVRSQYDMMNDAMYVFAKRDLNSSGKIEKDEPLHIFWISLKQPAEAKRLY